ncbi:MAG: YkgJ family cysteine cluster protein [Myxococcales bacterium]|nr:YkgJ family cysteine cluster protein [Myxococcales bacterium]
MALDDVVDLVANALRDLDRRQRETAEAVSGVRARLDALVDVLVAKELLTAGHQKHLERCAKNAGEERPKVRLRMYDPDKYNMIHGEPVDCADRIPLCKGRCCKLTIVLSEQDLDEGKLQWELQEPYVLRRGKDGRCVYQDRNTGFCGNYEHRPATCRSYSCKDDRRIWIDFENKIPAPPIRFGDDEAADDLTPR